MAYEPIILYACKCWGEACSKKQIQKLLKKSQREILIKCLKAYTTTSYQSALVLSGVPPIYLKIKEYYKHFNYYYHTTDSQNKYEQLFPLNHLLHPSEWKHLTYTHYNTKNPILGCQSISEAGEKALTYYTDGSKTSEGVGGAFVLFSSSNKCIRTKKFYLSNNCDIFQAELFSIERAINHAKEKHFQSFRICSDSLSSLLAIVNFTNHNFLATTIRQKICKLKQQNVKIELIWIRGHVGIQGNEMVDQVAKDAAQSTINEFNYSKINKSYLKREMKARIERDWNREYDRYDNRWLKSFFKNAKYNQISEDMLDVPEVRWIITGHGPFASFLQRMKVRVSSLCRCGQDVPQTPEHLLWTCNLTAELKEVRKVRNVCLESNHELLTCHQTIFKNCCKEICKMTQITNNNGSPALTS